MVALGRKLLGERPWCRLINDGSHLGIGTGWGKLQAQQQNLLAAVSS